MVNRKQFKQTKDEKQCSQNAFHYWIVGYRGPGWN